MMVDVNRIIDTVELDRLPKRRLHHLRVAAYLDRQTADRVEPIEGPRRLARRVLRSVSASRAHRVCDDEDRQSCSAHFGVTLPWRVRKAMRSLNSAGVSRLS